MFAQLGGRLGRGWWRVSKNAGARQRWRPAYDLNHVLSPCSTPLHGGSFTLKSWGSAEKAELFYETYHQRWGVLARDDSRDLPRQLGFGVGHGGGDVNCEACSTRKNQRGAVECVVELSRRVCFSDALALTTATTRHCSVHRCLTPSLLSLIPCASGPKPKPKPKPEPKPTPTTTTTTSTVPGSQYEADSPLATSTSGLLNDTPAFASGHNYARAPD